MHTILRIIALLACLLTAQANPAKSLDKLAGCTLVPTDWADGDSFRIRTAKGEEMTIRIYGADCIEWHVGDDSDARRLRAQRQYFGITEAARTPKESISLAMDFGKLAAEKTRELLAKPFTVHTRYRDALGDGKHKRIYAFVTCADGGDLASELVRCGLARAFGVDSDTPDGRSLDEYAAHLKDLELQSAKRGLGVWAKTNWDKLPSERKTQRDDEAEVNLATEKQTLPTGFKVDPNKASRDELMKLPGIGEAMANRIIEKRPYRNMKELNDVDGIGDKTLEKLMPFLDLPKSR